MTPGDARWMRTALALATRSLGQTWPNPAVAALIVREDRLIGRGITAPGGRPHAEARALDAARAAYGADALHGATAYVTLEPCAHHGLTPPCAEALARAGIARLVCPIEDPDPRVSGAGFAGLRAAGVQVDTGLMAAEARALNAGFLSRITRARPLVHLKMAATLDGRIATRTGESRWITGPEARRAVHLMRASHDAVLIGAGTARMDDPMLDVRGLGLAGRSPVRVVADSTLSLPLTGRLARSAGNVPLWLMHAAHASADRVAAWQALGARTIEVEDGPDRRRSMAALLTQLAGAGITRVLCEGGGQLAASLLRAGLADRLSVFSAGMAIGGDGRPAVERFGLDTLPDAPRFSLDHVRRIGPDVLTIWSRREDSNPA